MLCLEVKEDCVMIGLKKRYQIWNGRNKSQNEEMCVKKNREWGIACQGGAGSGELCARKETREWKTLVREEQGVEKNLCSKEEQRSGNYVTRKARKNKGMGIVCSREEQRKAFETVVMCKDAQTFDLLWLHWVNFTYYFYRLIQLFSSLMCCWVCNILTM